MVEYGCEPSWMDDAKHHRLDAEKLQKAVAKEIAAKRDKKAKTKLHPEVQDIGPQSQISAEYRLYSGPFFWDRASAGGKESFFHTDLLFTDPSSRTAITVRRSFYVCDRMTPIVGAPTFKTGQQIPDSGVYKVIHQQHRLPHEVTLLKGETFPRCAKCGDRVEFELVHAAPYQRDGTTFQVQLYALPDLDDEGPINALSLGLVR